MTDWNTVRQTAAQPSTCASEVTAIRDAAMGSPCPVMDILEILPCRAEPGGGEDDEGEEELDAGVAVRARVGDEGLVQRHVRDRDLCR